jgi:outer membrane protein
MAVMRRFLAVQSCVVALWAAPGLAAAACPDVAPTALTLPALLARGVCVDPRIAQQAAEIARTQGAVGEAAAAGAWQLSLQAGPSLATQQGSGGGRHTASAAGALVASRTLADGGQTRSRTAQREREFAAARADIDTTRQDTLRDLAGLWADAREAQAAVDAARRALDAARASDAAARARLAAGSATRVDALSAASTLAQAERDVISAEVDAQRRRGVLAERLALPADTRIALQPGDEAALLALLAQRIGTDTPAMSLEAHPQLAAQRERVQARRDALDATRAEDRATLSASASTGPNLARSNASTFSGGYDNTQRWSSEVALTWSMPLADGGARRSRTQQSQASLDAALAQQAQTERTLRESLWQQLTAWRSADAELSAAQAALAAAQAAEAAQRGRYEAGAGTLAEWITAQSDLSARRRQAAAAEQSRLRAAFGTAHALGRLQWEGLP